MGCWSQFTKLSVLSLHASLCSLCVWLHSIPPSVQQDTLHCNAGPFIPLSKPYNDLLSLWSASPAWSKQPGASLMWQAEGSQQKGRKTG